MIGREEGYKYQNTSAVRRDLLIKDIDELIRYSKKEGANEAKIPHEIAKIISDMMTFIMRTPETNEDLEIAISSFLVPWLCDVCAHTFMTRGNCATCGAGDTP